MFGQAKGHVACPDNDLDLEIIEGVIIMISLALLKSDVSSVALNILLICKILSISTSLVPISWDLTWQCPEMTLRTSLMQFLYVLCFQILQADRCRGNLLPKTFAEGMVHRCSLVNEGISLWLGTQYVFHTFLFKGIFNTCLSRGINCGTF